MTDQRRLDGVQQRPLRAAEKTKEPACVDCGVTELHPTLGGWPGRKTLRYYPADDEYSCKPCADGGMEAGGRDF